MVVKISDWLKPGFAAADRDKMNFENYEREYITFETMFYRFAMNNSIPYNIRNNISKEQMLCWMETIGWRRNGIYDIQERDENI